jgi:hypothetical protein
MNQFFFFQQLCDIDSGGGLLTEKARAGLRRSSWSPNEHNAHNSAAPELAGLQPLAQVQ